MLQDKGLTRNILEYLGYIRQGLTQNILEYRRDLQHWFVAQTNLDKHPLFGKLSMDQEDLDCFDGDQDPDGE